MTRFHDPRRRSLRPAKAFTARHGTAAALCLAAVVSIAGAGCGDRRLPVGWWPPGPGPTVPPGAGGAGGGPVVPPMSIPGSPAIPPPPVVATCTVPPAPMPVRGFMLSRQQLAERLAHLIWRAAPDTTVLAMAQTVQNSAQVADLARFMLADARSEQGLAALTSHWLHPERALSAVAKPEAGSVPASLRASMLRETQLFVTESMRKGASLTDLLTAPHTFANAGLGALYGVTGLPANEHRSVDLDPKQRSGLLTHASALFAHPRATSRGRWIREAFFCLAVPPPPPDVDLKLDTAPGATYRQTLERALDQPQCAACHVILDPPGFALENFDGLGRFRTLDNGLPIDATGKIISAESLEGAFVNGARDLGNKLGGACEVQRCVAQTFLSHALALDLADVNEVAVREVVAGTLAGGGFRLNDLILSVVQSPRFLAP